MWQGNNICMRNQHRIGLCYWVRVKNRRVAGARQQLPSAQTKSPLDTALQKHKPRAASSSVVAVTHFRIMSGRNSLRVSRCQIYRNKLHFIEHLPAEIDIQKHIPNTSAPERKRHNKRPLTHSCFCDKNVTCVAIKKKYPIGVGSIHACKSGGAMFKFCLSHLKTEEQKLEIITLLPVICTREERSTGKATEHRIFET